MQREERQLQCDPDGQEREGDRNRPRPLPVSQNLGDSHSQVFHAERAGHHIEQPDADDIERRTDAAHDQVLERGGQCPAILPERDHRIRRERGDLEENEDVEDVASNRDSQQSRHRQDECRVEKRDPIFADFFRNALTRIKDRDRTDGRDDHRHESTHQIDPVLDTCRRSPASESVVDHALGSDAL